MKNSKCLDCIYYLPCKHIQQFRLQCKEKLRDSYFNIEEYFQTVETKHLQQMFSKFNKELIL